MMIRANSITKLSASECYFPSKTQFQVAPYYAAVVGSAGMSAARNSAEMSPLLCVERVVS